MNSVLNPEAPEFHPLLTSAVRDGLLKCNKTVRKSNCFPIGHAYDVYKTYADFGKVTCKIRENVVIQSNQIVVTELPEVKLKHDELDEINTDRLIDVNDKLLDQINVNIDIITGKIKLNEFFIRGTGRNIAWNNPVITKIMVGDATFIGAKNIIRPQLFFKDPVDNSYNLWVPKISDKPNSMRPLELIILYNLDGRAVGYEHPYSMELAMYETPSVFLLPEPSEPEFPAPLADTPFTLVDTEAKLDELVKHLETCEEIAVDVEHHSYRSYQGITCLIQITTYEGGDFIIDTIALREHIHKLNHSFTNPRKVKVFHGAENDVKWLQRDFGVYIVGMFDTFQAGKILKLPFLSLKNLLARYCQIDADKQHQMADWRIRPLPEELIEYARTDTHYLLYMWRVMKRELLQAGGGYPGLLMDAFEKSRFTCCLTYNKEVMDDMCHMQLYMRAKKLFNSRQLQALRILYKWRDAQARELDEGPSYLIPNHMLLSLAETLPRDMHGINVLCAPMPPFVKVNLYPLHTIIQSCRELPIEPPSYDEDVYTLYVMNNQTQLFCEPHDLTCMPEYFSEDDINLDMAWTLIEQNETESGARHDTKPDVSAFAPIVASSTLNVNAKTFFPPYERHRVYRASVRVEEMKEFKEKMAKAVAKTEELLKLRAPIDSAEASCSTQPEPMPEPKTTVEQTEDNDVVIATKSEEKFTKKTSKRKRKMEKAAASQPAHDKKKEPQKNEDKVKSFHYKNVNYKKFFSEDKGHKQPKMQFKKP